MLMSLCYCFLIMLCCSVWWYQRRHKFLFCICVTSPICRSVATRLNRRRWVLFKSLLCVSHCFVPLYNCVISIAGTQCYPCSVGFHAFKIGIFCGYCFPLLESSATNIQESSRTRPLTAYSTSLGSEHMITISATEWPFAPTPSPLRENMEKISTNTTGYPWELRESSPGRSRWLMHKATPRTPKNVSLTSSHILISFIYPPHSVHNYMISGDFLLNIT